MKKWEKKITTYKKLEIIPDIIRWALIIGVLALVFYLIFTANIWGATIWAILWIPVGFVLLLNVTGFLTLPLYYLLALICGAGSIQKDFINEYKESVGNAESTEDIEHNSEQKEINK